MCDEFLRAHLRRLGLDVLTEPVICFRICARVLPLSNLVNLAPWPIGNAVGPRTNPPIRARIPTASKPVPCSASSRHAHVYGFESRICELERNLTQCAFVKASAGRPLRPT